MFGTRTRESRTAFLRLVRKTKWERRGRKKGSFVSNQGITQSRSNRPVQGQCRRTFHRFNSPSLVLHATILAAFLKGSNKELHKRHPPLIPRDHRIRLNPRALSFPILQAGLDNSRPNVIVGNCAERKEVSLRIVYWFLKKILLRSSRKTLY